MLRYTARRLLLIMPVCFGVTLLLFIVIHVLPGDIALLKLGDRANAEDVRQLRAALGLNRPLHAQYLAWFWDALHGDLGVSLWTGKPVLRELLSKAPVTLELTALAVTVSLIVALPVGVLSAVWQNSWIDYTGRLFVILGLAVPGFWVATSILTVTSIYFHWIPQLEYVALTIDPIRNLKQFSIPALSLGLALAAIVCRMTRAMLLEVLRQDYIRTAEAKGLRRRDVILRHGLRNSLIPVITLTGNQVGFLIGGAVVMEQIFSLPGLGRLVLDAIFQRDYPLLQGAILGITVAVVVVNLAVDLLYAVVDPRVGFA